MAIGKAIQGAVASGIGNVVPVSVTGDSHGGGMAGGDGSGEEHSYDGPAFGDEVAQNAIAEALKRAVSGVKRYAAESSSANSRSVQPSAQPSSLYPMTSTPMAGTSAYGGSTREVRPISANDVGAAVMNEAGSVLDMLGIDPKHQSALDVWEQQAADREGREVRTANYFDEEYEPETEGFSWDNQLDYVGNTATNDAYGRDALEHGLSVDDLYAITHRPDSIDAETKMHDEWKNISPDVYENVGKVIDDGTTYDYAHMTSPTMSGTQYMHYVEMGMGGRPIDEIDPTKTYNKRREANEYGFIPFTPDDTTYWNMVADNVLDVPARIGSGIANLREEWSPDYTINYGNGESVSGKGFDKKSGAYMNQFDYNAMFHPERYLSPQGDQPYTALVNEYAVPDVNGQIRYMYGNIVDFGQDDTLYLTFTDGQTVGVPSEEYMTWTSGDGGLQVPDSYYEQHGDIVDSGYDDTFYMTTSDGQRVGISPDYIASAADENGNIDLDMSRIPATAARGVLPEDLSSLNDVDEIVRSAKEIGGSPIDNAGVLFIPDMVLPDGETMSYDDVNRIYRDRTAGDDDEEIDPQTGVAKYLSDDDISYDFSGIGIGPLRVDNRPKRLNQQEMFTTNDDGSVSMDLSSIGNNAIDWTLGSLPISVPGMIPWIYAASNAKQSLSGMDPGTYDPTTDSYGLLAGGYDDDGNWIYGVTDENGERDDGRTESMRWWNAAGNAAVPLTEMIVGPVGEQMIPLEKIFGELPQNPTVAQVIKNTLIGAAGEGIEEDLGNIFDELTQYGPSGMFANQKTDDYGNPIYDQSGHEVRDYDTWLGDRIENAFDPGELANSFAGGVVVDMLMDALLSPINDESFTRQIGPALKRDIARRQTGVRQFVTPEYDYDPINDPRHVSDDYASLFDGVNRELERRLANINQKTADLQAPRGELV